jgi:hypothetical protein
MFHLSEWGNNYFLLYAARKTGLQGLQTAVASGWIRGAVTGVGLLNLGIAFWEILHFRQTVRTLQSETKAARAKDADLPGKTFDIPDNGRSNDTSQEPDR